MKNASITWDDRKGATKLVMGNLNLETGAIAFEAPIDVTFSSDFAVNGDEMVGKMTANTDINLSKDLQNVKLSGLKVDVESTGSLLRQIIDTYRVAAALTFYNGCLAQQLGNGPGIQGRRHYQESQILTKLAEIQTEGKGQV